MLQTVSEGVSDGLSSLFKQRPLLSRKVDFSILGPKKFKGKKCQNYCVPLYTFFAFQPRVGFSLLGVNHDPKNVERHLSET